jgi:hypothetical protein
MSPEEITIFESMLTEDEKEARLHGNFRHLVGRIYKEFDPSVHLVEGKKINRHSSWPIFFVCDPHDRKPHFGIWATVDPMGTIYVIDEIRFKGTIEKFSKEVLKREIVNKIRPLEVVRIGDPNKMETPTAVTGLKLKTEFAKWSLHFITNVNDDLAMGHLAVKGMLMWDQNSPISSTNRPRLYFFKETTQGIIQQIQTYVWDEWRSSEKSQKEKPKDANKDFPDCVRYLIMFNPQYFNQDDENDQIYGTYNSDGGYTGYGQ